MNDSPVDCQSRRRPRHAVRAATEPHPSRHFFNSFFNLIPADLAHLVERHLAKVEVAGSSPVIRSKTKRTLLVGVLFVLDGSGAFVAPKRRLALKFASQT